jgi:hypothetical protein
MKSGEVGEPSVGGYDLIQSVAYKICERWCFTVSEISCEFPQMSCTVLYKIITVEDIASSVQDVF